VKCNQDFEFSTEIIKKLNEGEYEVQYMTCPHCGKNYHILTIDDAMRELVNKRRGVENRLKWAQKKKMHAKQIRKLIREQAQIKAQQKTMLPELAKIGAEILTKWELGEKPNEEVPETEA
jgi:phage terminase large subunit GpA-like protein